MNYENILMHYLMSMLWTEELDNEYNVDDVDETTKEKAMGDICFFCSEAKELLMDWPDAHIGHNFWLTRNGHGTGFWDRNEYPNGEAITAIVDKSYRKEINVFVQDGKVFAE